MVPAMIGLDIIGGLFDDQPILHTIGEFGDRFSRAYLVGGPPMLMLQYTTGGRRPIFGFDERLVLEAVCRHQWGQRRCLQ